MIEKSNKALRSYYRKAAQAERDRDNILAELGRGNADAIDALHDWHQDNPGHEQEQDVADLRDYVRTDEDNHFEPVPTGSQQNYREVRRFYGRTPEERASNRARSSHAHLTGRRSGVGDIMTVRNDFGDITSDDHWGNRIHGVVEESKHGSRNIRVHVEGQSISPRHSEVLNYPTRQLIPHATHHLRKLVAQRQQASNQPPSDG